MLVLQPQQSALSSTNTLVSGRPMSDVRQTDHGNVVGNELSDGDTELARAEAFLYRRFQRVWRHGILHAAHHVLVVLLT